MNRYRREIAAPRVPIWLQRPVWRVLALLGRLRGHRTPLAVTSREPTG